MSWVYGTVTNDVVSNNHDTGAHLYLGTYSNAYTHGHIANWLLHQVIRKGHQKDEASINHQHDNKERIINTVSFFDQRLILRIGYQLGDMIARSSHNCLLGNSYCFGFWF